MSGHRLILVLAIIFSVEAATDLNYRLNIPIRPSSYAISITPYFDTNDSLAFTFDGEVTISLFTDQNTRQIKLHSEGLTFSASNVTVTRGATVLGLDTESPVTFDEKYTFVYVNLATELQSGVEYTLNIVYRGPIRSDLNGFYYNYYIENGVKKWLGATQMEPTHARKVFPCFDEPGLKATFTLTIDRPESFQPSLANTKMQTSTPLNNGYVREVFFPTPIMSSYLVAFLVSEFRPAQQAVEGNKEIGIYARPDTANQTDYAFTFASKVVDALSNYFGIDYYSTDSNLKLDHVALPDFRAGAMENWGLIKYRESLLLYVPEESTPYFKYRVAQIVAHETTHMWFGNLVTCHWWSNTWLNEGFANYFQDYITSMVDADVGSVDQLVVGSVYSAYDADDDPESVPITNENVNSPAEISGHFGTITYQKAGSVIRMMHHLLGDDAFKIGLNSYLEANKFDSGYPELMYTALGQGVNVTNALGSYTGSNIHDIMDSWISQAGHPVLKVDVDYENGTVSLTQERFYIDEDHETSEVYQIPITYTTSLNPDFNNTKPAFIMDTKFHMFTMSTISQNHSWIIFNIQETGLYRVDYDDHTWHLIITGLRGHDRTRIHHLNRAKIINDLFALFYADEVDFEIVYEGLQFLHEETDYSVIFAALRGLNKLRHSYLGTTALDVIKESQVNLLDSLITNIGYDIQAGEGTVAQRNRMQVLEYACMIGHQGCIDHAMDLFRGLRDNGTEISPSLRPVAYCAGLRYGNGEDFEFLWDRMVATNTANEMTIIGSALGCTTDQDKLKKYLVSMQVEDSPIRTQDLTVPLVSILFDYNNVGLVLDELKNGYEQWNTIYTTMDSVVSMIGSSLHTEEEFEKFTTWFSSCTQCTEQVIASAGKSLGKAKSVAGWARGHQEEILRVLRNNAILKTPSVTLLALSFVVIWLKF